MLIIGTIIGAGFCSGKEIVTYFAKYGFYSLFFVPLLFVLYYFIFKLFLSFGSIQKFDSIYEINKKIFGLTTKFINFLLFTIYLIFTSAMFAGIFQIGQNFNNMTSILLLIFAFVFAYFLLLKPFAILKKINAILIPILIVLIFVLCIKGIIQNYQSNFTYDVENPFLMFFNPIIYACQGLALAYYILIKTGENMKKNEIKICSFLVSLILCVMQSLIIIVVNLNPELLNSVMPMLSLAFLVGFPFDIVYLVLLFIAVLTTLFASSRSLYAIAILKIKNPKLCAFLCLLLGFILSFFGFDKIIKYLYPIIGVIGFYILIMLIYQLFFVNRFKFVNGKIHKWSKDT